MEVRLIDANVVQLCKPCVTSCCSSGHLNPAVTVGLLVGGQISVVKALLYISVQYVAGLIGAGVLVLVSVLQ